MENNDNNANAGLVALVFVLLLSFVVWLISSCTSNHYFSINADEISNPAIEYHDSTTVTVPF